MNVTFDDNPCKQLMFLNHFQIVARWLTLGKESANNLPLWDLPPTLDIASKYCQPVPGKHRARLADWTPLSRASQIKSPSTYE